MELSTREQDGVSVITLSGSVMGGPDAAQLNEKLHELIDAGKNKIVVDLESVQVMNSSGLGMLIGGLTTVRNSGGDLKIANASAKVASLITVAKLTSILPNYSTIEEAIKSF